MLTSIPVVQNKINLAVGRAGGREEDLRLQFFPDFRVVNKRNHDLARDSDGRKIELKRTSNTRPQLDATKFVDLSNKDRLIEMHFFVYTKLGSIKKHVVALYGEIADSLDPAYKDLARKHKVFMETKKKYSMMRFYWDLNSCQQTDWVGAEKQ